MNYKTKQRWFALSGLAITFLLIRVFQDDFRLAVKSDRPLEAGVQSVRYRFAKWNYFLNDFLQQGEIDYHPNTKQAEASGKSVFYGSAYGYENYQEKLAIPLILDIPAKADRENIVAMFNGRFGMADHSGEVIIPFVYDLLEFNKYTQYVEATKDDKQGIINRQGEIVIPLEYDELNFLHNNHNDKEYLLAKKGDRQAVIDLENNIIAPFKADRVVAHTPDITVVERGEVIGFVDGQKFTPFTIDEHDNYLAKDVAVIYYLDKYDRAEPLAGNYCVMNRQSKSLVAANTDNSIADKRIDNLCRQLATVKKLPILSKHSTREKELGKLIPVLINDKYGYLNQNQELVIAPQFDTIGGIRNGFYIVKNKLSSGIITPLGRYIPLPTKENGEYQVNEVTVVGYPDRYSDRYCIIDRKGNFLLSANKSTSSMPSKIDKINNICRNLVGIEVNNELVKEPEYPPSMGEAIYDYYFKENLIMVTVNGKRGYINRQGKLAFPQLFDSSSNFSEGLAAVQIGDRFGFINRSGKIVLPSKDYFPFYQYIGGSNCPKHGRLTSFENGLAIVSKIDNMDAKNSNCEAADEAKYYYLNKNNQIIAGDLINSSFFEAEEVLNNLFLTTIKIKNNSGDGYDYLYGLMRSDGEIVVQHQSELPEINYP